MRASVISAAFLALYPLGALAAALPETSKLKVVHEDVQDDGVIYRVYVPINETEAVTEKPSIQKREWCNTGANFASSDAVNLQNSLQNSNPNQLQYVPARTLVSWEWGTAKICINNWYAFENTHVKRWEAGWATGRIKGNCCSGSQCNGGETTCHGDSGLALDAQLMHSARDCPT